MAPVTLPKQEKNFRFVVTENRNNFGDVWSESEGCLLGDKNTKNSG